MQLILRLVILAVMAFSCSALADTQSSDDMSPWFTGPLLAPSGTTFPKGQIGFQPYVFYTDDYGVYNHLWKRENTRDTHTVNPEMAIFVGLTDSTELQFTLPYFVNTRNGQSSRGFGDFGIQFGYQVLREKAHTWIPDIKLTLAETFPTGRFENLSPSLNGTDAFGSGSYQTSVGLTFQKMVHFSGQHYLRGRWNFTYTMPTKVYVHGLNAYGGVANTDGIWNLGNHFSTDLAFEYTITRHWVPAIDFL
ncbi:MAG: hypothetical protein KDH94_02555 [Coxiellaceae bacterium]|nr:hypothetical protein [Coxiellaceae bacterium]